MESAQQARAMHQVVEALGEARRVRNFSPSHPFILDDIQKRQKAAQYQAQLVYLHQLTDVNNRHDENDKKKQDAVDAFFMMRGPGTATPPV